MTTASHIPTFTLADRVIVSMPIVMTMVMRMRTMSAMSAHCDG
jgi:hypothetical protein